MGIFSSLLKGTATDAYNKVAGNSDALEGMCSACAWTASAGGGIDPTEEDKAITVIVKKIGHVFQESAIEREFHKRAQQTKDRSGRSELRTQIEEAVRRDSDGSIGKSISLLAMDVADEGGISDEEKVILKQICAICRQDFEKLLAA